MRIGTFRSLTNPGKRYAIFRMGKTKNMGGDGTKWTCGCGASSNDPCKHLKCLWNYSKYAKLNDLIDGHMITLTKRGLKYFVRENPKNFNTLERKTVKKINVQAKKPLLKTRTKRYAKYGIGGFSKYDR